uniref:RWD domain-containing protein n=1 Tax=Araucaria cunninghamii TaxID=56994 RepID=A0A0D6R961_ARACU
MAEEVEEEMMALESIFYDSFSKINDHSFRLRIDPDPEVNKDEGPPPLFLEISLPDGYPQAIPQFDLSNLNNTNYSEPAKKAILQGLHDQASSQTGENMCYNLAEWLKDKLPEFFALKNVPAFMAHVGSSEDVSNQPNTKNSASAKKDEKDKMTKAQKRRYFDRFGAGGDKPRGWDWVSIVSHLSQVPGHGESSG